jgi:PadR family transcriptional regulator PadR
VISAFDIVVKTGGSMAQAALLRGTVDLLILKTLELEPRHGISIADRIAQITQGTFQVNAGSLFPALHRLEQAGCIDGEWRLRDDGRRVKTYRLTPSGQKQLVAQRKYWARVVVAMQAVLET